MKKQLEKQKKEFTNGLKIIQQRRAEWTDFENRASILLNSYVNTAKEVDYYEFLYVNNKIHPLIDQVNQNVLRFFAGNHPMGLISKKQDLETGRTTQSFEIENGGCLSFVQLPTGEVWVMVFPSKSEKLQWKDEYLFFGHFESPAKVSDKFISKAAEFYLRYSLITSFACKPTTWDNLQLWWLKFSLTNLFGSIGRGLYYSGRIAIAAKTGGLIH